MNADVGYFGPQSITWRIMAEPTSLVGGLRALLLQALHPDAMRLMADKSNFRDDPWDRLRRTSEYVALVTFGTTAQVDEAAQRVRLIHSKLGIDEPTQLAWVHACEVDSFLVAARRSGIDLSDAEADQFVAEQVIAARLIGAPLELIPTTVGELNAYFAAMRPLLGRTPQAASAARYLLLPPLPRKVEFFTPARAGWSTAVALAVGMLPRWARRMYRLPGIPFTDVANVVGMRALRTTVNALPERLSHGPIYREALARVS
jgi:uncharacterized protein (DUF2236 family)